MDVSSGNSWAAAALWSPSVRRIIPTDPPIIAKEAIPTPIFARKLRRVWPDGVLVSVSFSVAKVSS